MKTILNYKSILFKFILSLTIITVSIINSIPAHATTQQDLKVIDHYITMNNEVITVYENNTYYTNFDTNIQSISYIDNSITIEKDSNLFKFYVDEPRNYYLNEQINITMDQNNSIVDYIVDNEPQVYNTQISQIQGNTAYLTANGNKYSFENEEGSDGWKTGEKCKAVIQNGRLLEVKPIPLNER